MTKIKNKKEKQPLKRSNYLFVDGTNLYAGQYELFGPNRYLDFSWFIKQIQSKIRVKFDQVYFYASYSPKARQPTRKQRLYLKNEALFYRRVKEAEGVVFFKGYRSKTSGKEKEVDVKLAVDVVDFAHLNKYRKIFLFSGDADFMHALRIPQRLKKEVFILAIQNRVPQRLSYYFETLIFIFDRRKKVEKRKRQRIKLIFLNKDGLKNVSK